MGEFSELERRSWESCGRARSREDPLERAVCSCCRELIHEVTASMSEVSGSSRAAAVSRAITNMLSNEGLNIIALPKTIDNDIYGTDFTFGFHSV